MLHSEQRRGSPAADVDFLVDVVDMLLRRSRGNADTHAHVLALEA